MNGDKSVEEIKKTAVGAAKEAVQEVKESVEATAEDMCPKFTLKHRKLMWKLPLLMIVIKKRKV